MIYDDITTREPNHLLRQFANLGQHILNVSNLWWRFAL